MIVGVDEVGRGAWAGPLVVGAVAMGGELIPGLTDSKKLSAKRREILSAEIKQVAAGIGIGWVSAGVVDRIGISGSLTLATQRALSSINCSYDQIIIDGTVNFINDPRVVTMKQADLLVPSVSAASIIAKVARDRYMRAISNIFPGYGFERHVGYGTQLHQTALERQGVSALHRMSFAPMKGASADITCNVPVVGSGQLAEQAASSYLSERGFRILDRNWKTKWCEVDIIAERNNTVYFVEVKYRKTHNQGTGIEYVTPKKQRQMKFAAELWLLKNPGQSAMALSAISVTGNPMEIVQFIEQI